MEEVLFKNYNRIKLEVDSEEKILSMLEHKMEKLIGAPGDVKAQTYEEKSFSSSSKPIEQTYNEIVKLQQEINKTKLYIAVCKSLLTEIENKITEYLSSNASQAELVIFKEHWIKGTPLADIVVKKDRGKGYLDYRQIKRINRAIKEKIKQEI